MNRIAGAHPVLQPAQPMLDGAVGKSKRGSNLLGCRALDQQLRDRLVLDVEIGVMARSRQQEAGTG